MERLFNH